MVNKMQSALIKKELKDIFDEGHFFSNYMLLPLIMAVLLPAGLVIVLSIDLEALLADLSEIPMFAELIGADYYALIDLILNTMIAPFFLMIPILTVLTIATSTFAGEKERKTLETLLYSPMSLREIVEAKIMGAFLLGMIVTLVSFITMIIIIGLLLWLTQGILFIPDLIWIPVILLVSPAFSLIGITLKVRVSAKAKSVQQAQQRSAVLIMPLLILIIGQFSGIVIINTLAYFIGGITLAILAVLLMRMVFRKLTYEELLR
jgi:ABC-type transport system involved in multi-copper enzyme maturation permease subunit